MKTQQDSLITNAVGKYTALLTVSEVGLGSLLHAWHIPMSGHFLSLNQGFLLIRATRSVCSRPGSLGFKVSVVASLLKSLSPMGKKLTPMLAISVQGLLFSFGQILFGNGLIGSCLSLILLSLWAFAQPIIIYLFIFGQDITFVWDYFFKKLAPVVNIQIEHLFVVLTILVVAKGLLAIIVAVVGCYGGDVFERRYAEQLKKFKPKKIIESGKVESSFGGRIRQVSLDLLKPWFFASLTLVCFYLFITEAQWIEWLWGLLRPVAFGFLIFYLLRYLPIDKWVQQKSSSESFIIGSMKKSLQYIKRSND